VRFGISLPGDGQENRLRQSISDRNVMSCMVIWEREFIHYSSSTCAMCHNFPLNSQSWTHHSLPFLYRKEKHLTAAVPSKNRTTQLHNPNRLPRPPTPRRFAAAHDTQRCAPGTDVVFDTKNRSACIPVRRWSPRGIVIWLSDWLWHWVTVGRASLGNRELLYGRSGLVGWWIASVRGVRLVGWGWWC
jgi:hypothetical protein